MTDRQPRLRFPRLAQYALGLRLASTGSRDARLRVLLSAVAVGLGVAMLLLVASIPAMEQHRNARTYTQNDAVDGSPTAPPTGRTLLIGNADTAFKGHDIRGRVVQPDGPGAPRPPGVARYPAPGQMAVSPALEALLRAPGSALLRERLPYPVSGTIGEPGLLGPAQLSYVLGSDRLSQATGAVRIDHFGQYFPGKPLSPVLVLLCIVGFVVMLVPVGVFLGAAARFGGERRDRRLAALRLAGADHWMTARIAAGESLAGSVLGLAAGLLLFLAGRQLLQYVSVEGVSFYAQDVTPQPVIAVLVLVLVPLLAVAATMAAMRGVAVDPLGVVRRSAPRRRRLWWRVLPLPAGLAALSQLVGRTQSLSDNRIIALACGGILLLLAGVAALLPWLVGAVTRRVSGGGLSWQLAVRRLQADGGGSASRAVSGIVVAIAGAIALQTLFAAVAVGYAAPPSGAGQSAPRYQAQVGFTGQSDAVVQQAARIRSSPGVAGALGVTEVSLSTGAGSGFASLVIADCATLRQFATLPRCADGDFFDAHSPGFDGTSNLTPGTEVNVGFTADALPGPAWRLPAVIPATALPDPATGMQDGEFLTTPGVLPAALTRTLDSTVYVALDRGRPDAVEQLRTTVALMSPMASVFLPDQTTPDRNFSVVSRALVIGAAVTLLLIAASLLVGLLEQLREHRRVLAVLHAVGTGRPTVALSVLWQSAVPMVLGLLLAVGGGLLLGGALLDLAGLPLSFDWGAVGLLAGLGTLAVLLVTVLGLPLVLRMMRPGGLHFE